MENVFKIPERKPPVPTPTLKAQITAAKRRLARLRAIMRQRATLDNLKAQIEACEAHLRK